MRWTLRTVFLLTLFAKRRTNWDRRFRSHERSPWCTSRAGACRGRGIQLPRSDTESPESRRLLHRDDYGTGAVHGEQWRDIPTVRRLFLAGRGRIRLPLRILPVRDYLDR